MLKLLTFLLPFNLFPVSFQWIRRAHAPEFKRFVWYPTLCWMLLSCVIVTVTYVLHGQFVWMAGACGLGFALIWMNAYFFQMEIDSSSLLKSAHLQKKYISMQDRFLAAMSFLKKRSAKLKKHRTAFDRLPWFLLLGMTHSGKSTMLHHTALPYILKKNQLNESVHFDWWVTSKQVIVDVPSYLFEKGSALKNAIAGILWKRFLQLMYFFRGKNALSGVLVVLPAAEYLSELHHIEWQEKMKVLMERLQTCHRFLKKPIRAYLILSKSDHLEGFSQYFSEISPDDRRKPWGVSLHGVESMDAIPRYFSDQFNILIRDVNSKLLPALHREYDLDARYDIKELPLALESLKQAVMQVLTDFCKYTPFVQFQGVYLLGQQTVDHTLFERETIEVSPDAESETKELMRQSKSSKKHAEILFSYDLLNAGLVRRGARMMNEMPRRLWMIACSTLLFCAAGIVGHDYWFARERLFDIEKNWQSVLVQASQDRINLSMLDAELLRVQREREILDVPFWRFFSRQVNVVVDRMEAELQDRFLLFSVKKTIEQSLSMQYAAIQPEWLYQQLAAYVMLANPAHRYPDQLISVLKKSVPELSPLLQQHIKQKLKWVSYAPTQLNQSLIAEKRQELLRLDHADLAFLILKHQSPYFNAFMELNASLDTSLFLHGLQPLTHIPLAYGNKSFTHIMNEWIPNVVQQSLSGNWVTGDRPASSVTPQQHQTLVEAVQANYVNEYIQFWEQKLDALQFRKPEHLTDVLVFLQELKNKNSALFSYLAKIHEETYFDPIVSASQKLEDLATLYEQPDRGGASMLDRLIASAMLFDAQVRSSTSSPFSQKMGYDYRQDLHSELHASSQFRLLAVNAPWPIRQWLQRTSHYSDLFIEKQASQYMNLSAYGRTRPVFSLVSRDVGSFGL